MFPKISCEKIMRLPVKAAFFIGRDKKVYLTLRCTPWIKGEIVYDGAQI